MSAGVVRAPHRFSNAFGGTCATCGHGRFDPLHFNGDSAAAKIAHDEAKTAVDRRRTFEAGLSTGVRVTCRDDHPRDSLAGRAGTVVAVEHATKTATVKWDPDELGESLQVAVPLRYLEPGSLPVPPRFSSIEEAEAWMEEHAPEMGVEYPKLPPTFSSVEEADEWMRQQRQQRQEPYVPASWAYDPNTTPDWDAHDAEREEQAKMLALLQQVVAPAPAMDPTPGTTAWIEAGNRSTAVRTGVRGYTPQAVTMDEAADFNG